MRRTAAICISVALLVAPLGAKGPTTRIVIKDLERGGVVEITDRSVLDQFQVWSGKGTYSGSVEGTEGFIVDWQAGIVEQRPTELRRYEVRFYVAREECFLEKSWPTSFSTRTIRRPARVTSTFPAGRMNTTV